MKNNIGKFDRISRIVIGCALIGSSVVVSGTMGFIMAAIGLVPLLTGLMGNCPAYSIFRIDTCKNKLRH